MSALFGRIGDRLRRPDVVQFAGMMVMMPLMFVSGAFAPLDDDARLDADDGGVNPVAHATDALRGAVLGTATACRHRGRARRAGDAVGSRHPGPQRATAVSDGLRLRALRTRDAPLRAAPRRSDATDRAPSVRRPGPPAPRTRSSGQQAGAPRHGVGSPLRGRIGVDQPHQIGAPSRRRRRHTPGVVRTVRGRGYRFVAEVTEQADLATPSERPPVRCPRRRSASGRHSAGFTSSWPTSVRNVSR